MILLFCCYIYKNKINNFVFLAFHKKILQQLMIIKQQNEEIYTLLNNRHTQQLNTCLPENLSIQLPLKSNNNVTMLEEYL